MKWVKKLQWFLYGILMVLYCIQFHQMRQRYITYKQITDQQKDVLPGQWVQKQQCWPNDGKNHLNEQFEFCSVKMKSDDMTIGWVGIPLSEKVKRFPHATGNCVTYWERIK